MASLVPRGYRSATKYRFGDEQTDAIIRNTTGYRKHICPSVIWFSPLDHVDVRLSTEAPFQRTSNVGLGSLDRLPLELLHNTLFHLDMHSLLKFRQTNLRSRQTVDCLKQHQIVVLRGLDLLCALLRTRLATDISLFDFYDALCTKACTLCGEFGGFMSLLTWKRCCFNCLRGSPEIEMQSLAAVRKQYHLTKAELNQLRSFKTFSGPYAVDELLHKYRIKIVSILKAISVCRQQSPRPQLASSERNRLFDFMGSCALPYYDKRACRIERGLSCRGCQLALTKDIDGCKGEQ